MASIFTSRRKPKRVGRESGANHDENDEDDSGPIVRKPTSKYPKPKSKLRLSFNPGEAIAADSSDSPKEPEATQKRPVPPDRAQSLLRQSWGPNTTSRESQVDRPTYSKDYLSELRNSTPTTPRDLSAYTSSAEDDRELDGLDVSSKFGAQPSSSAHIPSAAEIREKKDRRARAAKSQGAEDFIALEDYDSDGEFKPQRMQVSAFLNRDKSDKKTRLFHDDEDIAEGFESFVDDPGKVTLSRKAQRLQSIQQRQEMASLIQDAEHSSSESDSEVERNYAYESAQTSHGMDGLSLHRSQQQLVKRHQAPKEVTPIPKLAAVLARFREGIQGLEFERERLNKRAADLQKEKAEIAAREENIQMLLSETGEKFERLKREAEAANAPGSNGIAGHGNEERGLESLGGTPGP